MTKVTDTSKRKSDHIQISLQENISSGLSTGLEKYRFSHNALPELDYNQIECSLTFLGHALDFPLLISSMTGGTEQANRINIRLAEAAQSRGIALALGSLRAALEDSSLVNTYQIRTHAPDILCFANLGAVQLNYGLSVDDCRRAVDMVQADALILHLNPLQEALQPEGNTNFQGLLPKIEAVCGSLELPLIIKEVGWGISSHVAQQLVNVGVAAIDVAGAGGTSWSQVEMFRAQTKQQAHIAAPFVDWGIPTAQAIKQIREVLPEIPLIGSGGLRSGLDAAKCIALGANLCGMASPFLKAATESTQAVLDIIDTTATTLKAVMFATGSPSLESLAQAELISVP